MTNENDASARSFLQLSSSNLFFALSALLSAGAAALAVHHPTPVDGALPLLAIAVTLFARLSYPAVMLGVPLLIVAEMAIPDEHLRLMAFGGVLAAAIGAAVSRAVARPGRVARGDGDDDGAGREDAGAPLLAVTALVLLRWIPLEDVLVWRELFLLVIAAATVVVLGRTPFGVAVAVITALVTPAVPLRTLALPVIVLFAAAVARTFGLPRLRLTWPSAVVLAFLLLFFAWSGVVARACPYFLRRVAQPVYRTPVAQALAPNRSATYVVPDGATMLVVSGANVARFRRGATLGRVQPGNLVVRIGDAADWGYLRRDHWYAAHNPLPRDPAGRLRGYGYTAWVDGAGRIPLPRGARTIQVTADAALPADASLQVEGFE